MSEPHQNDAKADLVRYLHVGRDALRWKLEGLGELDARRSLTPTGLSLLGLVHHVAICAAGVRVVEHYAGRTDTYGNDLHVTAVALADELASAADLVKTKLAGRPVALVRGLAHLVGDDEGAARDLARDPAQDMFGHGSQEAVLAAVLRPPARRPASSRPA